MAMTETRTNYFHSDEFALSAPPSSSEFDETSQVGGAAGAGAALRRPDVVVAGSPLRGSSTTLTTIFYLLAAGTICLSTPGSATNSVLRGADGGQFATSGGGGPPERRQLTGEPWACDNSEANFSTVPVATDISSTAPLYAGAAAVNESLVVFAPYGADHVGLWSSTTGFSTVDITDQRILNVQFKYWGAAAAGHKVYFAPYDATEVGVLDTTTTTPTFSTIATNGLLSPTTGMLYSGAVYLPFTLDKYVVFIPYNSNNIGLVNTKDDTFSTTPAVGGFTKYAGAALVDSAIFFAPAGQGNIGKLQWGHTDAEGSWMQWRFSNISTKGLTGNQLQQNYRGAAAVGDRIFFAPYYANNIGVLNATSSEFSVINVTDAAFGVVTPNGCRAKYSSAVAAGTRVIFAPAVVNNIGVLDTTTDTFSTIDIPVRNVGCLYSSRFLGAAVTNSTADADGRIIFAPYNSRNIGILDPLDCSNTPVASPSPAAPSPTVPAASSAPSPAAAGTTVPSPSRSSPSPSSPSPAAAANTPAATPASPPASSPSPSTSPPAATDGPTGTDPGPGTGAIAGAIGGGLAIIAVAVYVFCFRRRCFRSGAAAAHKPASGTSSPQPMTEMPQLSQSVTPPGTSSSSSSAQTAAAAAAAAAAGGDISGGGAAAAASAVPSPPQAIQDRGLRIRGKVGTIPAEEITELQKLGNGAFGIVCKGEWRPGAAQGKAIIKVAIKKILNDKCQDAAAQEALLKENEIASKMNSPFVAKAFGSTTMPGGFMIIMEFCELGDLESYLHKVQLHKKPQFAAPTMLQVATQAMCGIGYLHRHQMLHRDIAARNLLVTRDERGTLTVKLADFGMTRAVEQQGNRSAYYKIDTTMDGGRLMIPVQHSPPEYFEKQQSTRKSVSGEASYKATTSGDMWAAGVLMWEIVTLGQKPYIGKGSISFMEGGLELTELPSMAFIQKYLAQGVRLHLPDDSICPPAMRIIMQACWKDNPVSRPTADEAIAALSADPLFAVNAGWTANEDLVDYLELQCKPPIALLPGAMAEDSFFAEVGSGMYEVLKPAEELQASINEFQRDEDYDFDEIFPGGPTGEACANFVTVMAELSSFANAIEEDSEAPLAVEIQAAKARIQAALSRLPGLLSTVSRDSLRKSAKARASLRRKSAKAAGGDGSGAAASAEGGDSKSGGDAPGEDGGASRTLHATASFKDLPVVDEVKKLADRMRVESRERFDSKDV